MDRFIDFYINNTAVPKQLFKIQYGQIYSVVAYESSSVKAYLKSNMDRFIAATQYFYDCLKREFKIQYGQIYSCLTV